MMFSKLISKPMRSRLRRGGKSEKLSHKPKLRIQCKVEGGRLKVSGAIPPAYLEVLRSLARKHQCSVAMVITTALSDTIGLDVEERFDMLTVVPRRRRA